jgi:hypothetical protein
MKTAIALLLFCALLPTAFAEGGFLSNILREVTGAVGSKDAPAPAASTSVLGIRGMDEGGAKSAGPATGDLKLLESWAVGRKEAEAAAGRRGLAARAAEYKKPPPGKATTQAPL